MELKLQRNGWKTYAGKIEILFPNQIFVFGSNPQGRHGAGTAWLARQRFGAKQGKGRGLSGKSYALITKNLQRGFIDERGVFYKKEGERSIDPEIIRQNIRELYECAEKHPEQSFLIAYTASGLNRNGYSSIEMAEMFSSALEEIPKNIVFEESFFFFGFLFLRILNSQIYL